MKTVAQKVIEKFGTNNVFAIAERAGVKIVYESWYPVTIGEFERKTRTIRVNRKAIEDNKDILNFAEKIVAHELGHFFAVNLNLEKIEEEDFAHKFAERLMKNDE